MSVTGGMLAMEIFGINTVRISSTAGLSGVHMGPSRRRQERGCRRQELQ
jgi:hypothetical protein